MRADVKESRIRGVLGDARPFMRTATLRVVMVGVVCFRSAIGSVSSSSFRSAPHLCLLRYLQGWDCWRQQAVGRLSLL